MTEPNTAEYTSRYNIDSRGVRISANPDLYPSLHQEGAPRKVDVIQEEALVGDFSTIDYF